MYLRRRLFWIFFLSLLFSYSIWGLEINKGRIKIVLYKDSGRFSIYYLVDKENDKYISFFHDKDVRTSTLSIVLESKIYKLGETGSFKQTIEETDYGARFIWKSKQLEVIEDFAFVTSETSSEVDGVIISLKINNVSDKNLNIGLRYLFDTHLGESGNHHFKTNIEEKIEHETEVLEENMIKYWISPIPNNTENVGLQMITKGRGIVSPDKIIFANWKRLNETSWSYTASSERNFSLRPYSINDSAVAHYYYPKNIDSGSTLNINFICGNYSEGGFSLLDIEINSEFTNIINDSTTSDNSIVKITPEIEKSIESDLVIIENLLTMINNKLNSSVPITEKDILVIQGILKKIEENLKNYK